MWAMDKRAPVFFRSEQGNRAREVQVIEMTASSTWIEVIEVAVDEDTNMSVA
jgi:hypothetical protein